MTNLKKSKLYQIFLTLLNRISIYNPKISLTFDDGYKYTEQILEKLADYNQKATFFLCGDCIEKHMTITQKIYSSEHEIGNHSYHHPDMTKLSCNEIVSELTMTQQLIDTITENHNFKLFRFPYGASNESSIQLVEKAGFTPVSWTIDSKDWTGISATEIYNNIVNSWRLCNGAIILMHTTGEHTAEALDLLIPELIRKHYTLMTVSDLFHSVPAYRKISVNKMYKPYN